MYNMQVPTVDEEMWRQLNRETVMFDYSMKKDMAYH